MKLRVGMLVAGLVAAVASLAVVGSSGAVYAEKRDSQGEVDMLLFIGADFEAPRWLRHSIIVCAARTMDSCIRRANR